MTNGDKYSDKVSNASLVTTTTGAGQVMASITPPNEFRGTLRATLEAVSTNDQSHKSWWSVVQIRKTGSAVVINGTPVDIVPPVESGAQVGAATLAVVANGGAVDVSVTPANTNSVRWACFLELDGVVEDFTVA